MAILAVLVKNALLFVFYESNINTIFLIFQRQRVDSVLQKHCQAVLPQDTAVTFQSLTPQVEQVIHFIFCISER